MSPGDLVTNRCFLDLYHRAESVNRRAPDDGIPMGSVGIILAPTDGTWVKWMVGGKVGWSDFTLLQVIS